MLRCLSSCALVRRLRSVHKHTRTRTVAAWRRVNLRLIFQCARAQDAVLPNTDVLMPAFAVTEYLAWFWAAADRAARPRRPPSSVRARALESINYMPAERPAASGRVRVLSYNSRRLRCRSAKGGFARQRTAAVARPVCEMRLRLRNASASARVRVVYNYCGMACACSRMSNLHVHYISGATRATATWLRWLLRACRFWRMPWTPGRTRPIPSIVRTRRQQQVTRCACGNSFRARTHCNAHPIRVNREHMFGARQRTDCVMPKHAYK